MRDLNEYTVGAYLSFVMVLLFIPMVYFIDEGGLSIIYQFDPFDWALIISIGITGTYFNIFRFKAL